MGQDEQGPAWNADFTNFLAHLSVAQQVRNVVHVCKIEFILPRVIEFQNEYLKPHRVCREEIKECSLISLQCSITLNIF